MVGTRTRRLRLVGMAAVALTVASVSAGAMSLALFTDTASVGSNTFSTGTIDIAASPTSAVLTSSALLPGDTINGSLTIANNGSAQLRYAMTSASTNADSLGLAAQMTLVVKTLGTDCATFDGTTIYTGSLDGASFGDPAAGSNTGDRTLNSSASEVLCLRAALPLNTGNAFQGATTTTTFTFNAEQTANNP